MERLDPKLVIKNCRVSEPQYEGHTQGWVFVTLEDYSEQRLANYNLKEITFSPLEFIGLTVGEAQKLVWKREREYLDQAHLGKLGSAYGLIWAALHRPEVDQDAANKAWDIMAAALSEEEHAEIARRMCAHDQWVYDRVLRPKGRKKGKK